MVIILKAVRQSAKAGAGAMPLSTSGRVGSAGSRPSGGHTADAGGKGQGLAAGAAHAQLRARALGG